MLQCDKLDYTFCLLVLPSFSLCRILMVTLVSYGMNGGKRNCNHVPKLVTQMPTGDDDRLPTCGSSAPSHKNTIDQLRMCKVVTLGILTKECTDISANSTLEWTKRKLVCHCFNASILCFLLIFLSKSIALLNTSKMNSLVSSENT